MPGTLKTGLHGATRTSLAEDSAGAAVLVNGMGRGVRVRGDTVKDLGILTPTSALSVSAGALTSTTGRPLGTYQVYVRYVDDEGIPSSLSPVAQITVGNTAATTPQYVEQLNYTNIPISPDSRVTKRQIFRNTNGQLTTFYLDLELNNNTATTGSSTRGDNDLAQQTALPIVNADGSLNANRFDPPPYDKAVVVAHQDRYYYFGDVEISQGHVELTSGVATCELVGPTVTSAFVGRVLDAGGKSITITGTSGSDHIVLASAWPGPTDKLADYVIRLSDKRRETIQYTAPGEPESAPEEWTFRPIEDGDRLTGGFDLNSYLYFTKRRHIYNYSTWRDPARDAGMFLRANRGALNHRCAVNVEGNVYLMDREGIYLFDGSQAQQISGPVQDFFRDGHVNFDRQDEFHMSYYPEEEVVRAFVVLGGHRFPRHAFCFHYRLGAWWVEEYPFDVTSSMHAELGGRVHQIAGLSGERIVVLSDAPLDGDLQGTTRGTVSAATADTVTVDSQPSGVAGWPLHIVDGRGRGQSRVVVEQSGTRLTVDRPWDVLPDATSTWQVGGVPWRVRFGWFRYVPQDGEYQRRQVTLVWQKLSRPSVLWLRRYEDFDEEPIREAVNVRYHDGTESKAGDEEVAIDLSSRAMDYVRFTEKLVDRIRSGRHVLVELAGVQEGEEVRLAELLLDGMA